MYKYIITSSELMMVIYLFISFKEDQVKISRLQLLHWTPQHNLMMSRGSCNFPLFIDLSIVLKVTKERPGS